MIRVSPTMCRVGRTNALNRRLAEHRRHYGSAECLWSAAITGGAAQSHEYESAVHHALRRYKAPSASDETFWAQALEVLATLDLEVARREYRATKMVECRVDRNLYNRLRSDGLDLDDLLRLHFGVV